MTGVTLLKRYKRFLADVELDDGSQLTVHCPNTGAMTGCADPGSRAWISESDNPKRKYPHTLEFVETGSGLVSVNTGRANQLVGEALREGWVTPLADLCSEVKAEVAIPSGEGRFDFAVTDGTSKAFIEVKSVTLYRTDGLGAFPDAVSERARKHVTELARCVAAGDRGVLLFCAQHCGIERVAIAEDIDPDYADAVAEAARQGVEVLAVGCRTDLSTMRVDRPLPLSGLD